MLVIRMYLSRSIFISCIYSYISMIAIYNHKRGNITSRFSKTNGSEYLENLKEMFP